MSKRALYLSTSVLVLLLLAGILLTMPTAAAPKAASRMTVPAGQDLASKGQNSLAHIVLPPSMRKQAKGGILGPVGFQWDDGSPEEALGWGSSTNNYTAAAIWLNRFPLAGTPLPLTLNQVHILWPGPEAGNFVGKNVRLVAYLDTDADGYPGNATLIHQSVATIQVANWTTFQTYPVNVIVEQPGDLYIGWEDLWAETRPSPQEFPAAIDTTSSSGNSWVVADQGSSAPNITNLEANSELYTVDEIGFPGNWMIRASGSSADPVTPTPQATATPEPTATPVPPRCPGERFTDVCPDDYFYTPTLQLNDRGIVSGYDTAPPCDGPAHIPCFKPYSDMTRGQVSKVVSNAAGFAEDPGPQIYEDVLPSNTFYTWINRLSLRGHVGGYPCGSVPEEPCVGPGNRPYFRWGNTVTRGQLSKIVSNAAGFAENHTTQTFEDVPTSNGFYIWIERLASRGIINGYPCGGTGEPCVAPNNRPYFRVNNNVIRGQVSKIVYISWP
jgi:hypothetical protein